MEDFTEHPAPYAKSVEVLAQAKLPHKFGCASTCYRRLAFVTQTNTLFEILIQDNTLQRFRLARMGSGRYKGTLL